MTTKYAAKHGAGLQNTLQAIADREPFNAGNLTGHRYSQGVGILRQNDREVFYADVNETDYFVYSYDTPIAWHTPQGWVVPTAKYSRTTSNHQGVVTRALVFWVGKP